MIPAFTDRGTLPPGIHPATMEEIRTRFARFKRSNRRIRLFNHFEAYVETAQTTNVVECLYLVGSYVTNKDEPQDIDLLIVFPEELVFQGIRPAEYNLIHKNGIRRAFGSSIDGQPVQANSPLAEEMFQFFQSDREGEPIGIVEVIFNAEESQTTACHSAKDCTVTTST